MHAANLLDTSVMRGDGTMTAAKKLAAFLPPVNRRSRFSLMVRRASTALVRATAKPPASRAHHRAFGSVAGTSLDHTAALISSSPLAQITRNQLVKKVGPRMEYRHPYR